MNLDREMSFSLPFCLYFQNKSVTLPLHWCQSQCRGLLLVGCAPEGAEPLARHNEGTHGCLCLQQVGGGCSEFLLKIRFVSYD